jgi:lysophospholipase L1-like esterase
VKIQSNSKLLFIGDSITDCGRARPIGQGVFDQALGNGYVNLVDAAFASGYPDYRISTINMGVSGNTVRDLKARWSSDVMELKPDWLSVMIGINDVWGNFSLLGAFRQNISEQEFTDTLTGLIQQVRPSLQGLVLMTPYYLETNRQEPLRDLMDRFGDRVKEIAETQDAILVDTQAHFDRVLECTDPFHLAEDRVHVNSTGHMILARAFLGQIGFDWNRKPNPDR